MKLRYLFLFILAFGITSCTTMERASDVSLQDGEGLFAAGDYENAYKAFVTEAESSEGIQKSFFRIRAAAALAKLERTRIILPRSGNRQRFSAKTRLEALGWRL